MMALLDDDTLVHPPLECVFTVQEEVGLIGAASLDGSLLSAETMINLDSEEEGVATVSCAGGLRMQFDRQAKWQSSTGRSGLLIKISGLPGGHSGIDIDKERTNANKLMGRVLASFPDPFDIAYMKGGNKDNAIPREAEALIAFDSKDAENRAEHVLDSMLVDPKHRNLSRRAGVCFKMGSSFASGAFDGSRYRRRTGTTVIFISERSAQPKQKAGVGLL